MRLVNTLFRADERNSAVTVELHKATDVSNGSNYFSHAEKHESVHALQDNFSSNFKNLRG